MTQAVQLASYGSTGQSLVFKNRIINGDMKIDQRNNGAAVTLGASTSGFPVDRIRVTNQTDGTFTVQQSTTAPIGFNNSVIATVTATDTSLGGTQYAQIEQRIEGFNVADLGWGTANAQAVTLSFYVRSSLTGTFCVTLYNSNGSRVFVSTYTINTANTYEQKTVTVPGDIGGTWQTGTSTGIDVIFCLAVGATYQQAAGNWGTTSFAIGTSAQTNLMATNGATFFITGVQLEVGSVATPFERRPFGTELALCQRYFCKTFPQSVAPANGLGFNYFLGYSPNSANPITIWKFPVTMRSAPTVTLFSDRVGGTAGQWTNGSVESTYARALGTSTEFVMLDNTSVSLTSNNWWLGGATAAIEL